MMGMTILTDAKTHVWVREKAGDAMEDHPRKRMGLMENQQFAPQYVETDLLSQKQNAMMEIPLIN